MPLKSAVPAIALGLLLAWGNPSLLRAGEPSLLDVGIAGHAFDHLGGIADQAQAAAASGANIIYITGLGDLGYLGLPPRAQLEQRTRATRDYLDRAHAQGIRLSIGYLCATSIVNVKQFDRNWTPEFRSQFASPPADWLQRDRTGKVLPSWYGGDYAPACMNNPDWRIYERAMVRRQLEAGNDGIFFDNPTVHPQGCFCEHCMRRFARFLGNEAPKPDGAAAADWLAAMRKIAVDRPNDFLRFRGTIASDFLSDMRAYARSIKPDALVTCNNSLNAPGVFFSQCRTYGYNIRELSRAEDWVLVEDMSSQPRVLPNGNVIDYGPVYEMLHAIAGGKPVVAITVADADYHTPPHLERLAMAEAAAHGASYLGWPTWPENVRPQMIAAIRPQADLLRANAALLNGVTRRADVLVFLPFRRWVETTDCRALAITRTLDAMNVQFRVVSEDDFEHAMAAHAAPALIAESQSVLSDAERRDVETFKAAGGQVIWAEGERWTDQLPPADRRSLVVRAGPPTLRVELDDQPGRTIVHLLNLNVLRVSSLQDRVTPANDVHLEVRVPFEHVHAVEAITADTYATQGEIPFTTTPDRGGAAIQVTVPRVEVSTILKIESR